MKKILISLSIIGVVGALAIGGTIARFYDVEVVEENVFVAGTLDLNVDGENAKITMIDIEKIAPGDHGHGHIRLKNVGNLAGELDIAVSVITESSIATDEFADGYYYLADNLQMVLWIDRDQDGYFDRDAVPDIELLTDGVIDPFCDTYNRELTFAPAIEYCGNTWDNIMTMGGGAFDRFTISWYIPTDVGNIIQGDGMEFDVTFTLEQAIRY